MGIFEKAVKERGRITIKNASVLAPESHPIKEPISREWQIRYIVDKISAGLKGKAQSPNLFVFGPPGTGKTYCIQWILKELREYVEKHKLPIRIAYVNAGKTRTAYFTMLEICRSLGISVPPVGWQMFRLKQAYQKLCVDHQIVVAIDEFEILIHKEKEPLVYYLSRQPQTTLILISNKFTDFLELPEKARSSLMLIPISFQNYSEEETLQILKEKVMEAFYASVFSEDALDLIAKLTSELNDLRIGLKLLHQLGEWAERIGKNSVEVDDVKELAEREVRIKELELKRDLLKRRGRR